MLMRVNIRCHIFLSFSQCVLVFFNDQLLFCTDVVILVGCYTTVPVAFRLYRSCAFFMNLGVQGRYLPTIIGPVTPFPCVPTHFNH